MTEPATSPRFDGWAIVDVLGHQRYVGYVTTEAYGQAVLFRIDVPELDERERVTKAPGYRGGRYLPAGTTVKEGAVAGYSKLIGAGSIYAITPCTKAVALEAVEQSQPRPLMSVQLPPDRSLAAQVNDESYHAAAVDFVNDGTDDGEVDEDDDDSVDDGEIDLP